MAAEAVANGSKASQSVLVVRGYGTDKPGICEAFLQVVANHHCRVLDMGQFLLEGSLMLTVVLHVGDSSAVDLMKALTQCAKERSMQLDFHFPDSQVVAAEEGNNVAVLAVVSSQAITPALLYDLDTVLCEHGCVVQEIEHRSDNKRENNGEYNKVKLRFSCPKGLKLATLSMGAPLSSGGSSNGLQKAAWDHSAQVALRWWDAMNRPNGKSLVVFGLSNVLCVSDVLDEVLIEAGLDPAAVTTEAGGPSKEQKKVAMLKGKSVQIVQKVIEKLQFTPGARLVCGVLKRLGFRLAILTNTGMREITEHFKRQLGVDYAICRDVEVVDGLFTGEYTGDLSDVKFRKADLLKLMAEREGIEYRNVITVGEPLKGLKAANARAMMETFGPTIWFNSRSMPDLSVSLYLLGFNGSDVRSLRKRRYEDGPGAEPLPSQVDSRPAKRFMVQVSSRSCVPGQIRRIFEPLKPLCADVTLSTVRSVSLQDGGMCIGLDMAVLKSNPDEVLKDLLFACQQQGFQVMDLSKAGGTVPAPVDCWEHYHKNRYVITLVQKPQLGSGVLLAFFNILGSQGVNTIKIERLSVHGLTAMQFSVNLPDSVEASKFSAQLVEVSKAHEADIAFQRDDVERWMRRLVVFDMDSTLIQQEVIDELAKMAGVEEQVKAITEAAMRGELDFFGSLKSRVALLKGHKADELFASVKKNLIYTPGAKKLCTTLRSLGYKMAVISGGFLPVAKEVQRHLGLDYAFANTLEVDETTGLLTGQTSGPVVTPQRKRALLATIANIEGCEVQQTIAVGDGANDIPMLNAAGLGIAFCAKPKVQAVSEVRINQMDLSTVLFLIGVSERAMEHLGSLQEDGSSSA